MGLNVGFIVFGLAVGVVCVSSDCGVPPSIPNASHDWPGSTPIPEGTTVMYQCSTDYKPKLGADDATYVCSAAAWTDGNFECKQITCGHIEPPTNGHVVNEVTYVVGSNIKFACNEGYTLSGTSNLICRTDELWMPNYAPSCNIVSCPELPDIAHATTQLTYSINGVRTEYESVIKVMCTDGYIANGLQNVKCQANGQWTKLPTCSQFTCSPYPGLNSSCINQIAWEEELLLLYFVCNVNHTSATGPIKDGVSCTGGVWYSESMACYCDCHVAADLSLVQLNNVDASGYIKHGQKLSWSCKNGGSKIITDDSELCNDGSITVPECQPAPSVITTQETTQTPATTAPCDRCVYIKFANTTKEGETYKTLFCNVNVLPWSSCTLSWYTGSKEISRYSSDMSSVALLDRTSGFDSSFSVTGEGLALALVFPYTNRFNGEYVCMSQDENGDILSQAEYLFTNELPEKLRIIEVIIITVAVPVTILLAVWPMRVVAVIIFMGKRVLPFLSNDNSGSDVEFKSGKDDGNGAEVAMSHSCKELIDAAGERAPMMST